MTYAKALLDLQLQFADQVAELTGVPLPRVLLEYTNLYVRFGLGRDFRPDQPIWQEYLAGLRDAGDRREWTYRFYLANADETAGPTVVASRGCFAYALHGDRIRLHFRNADTAGHSSLSAACQQQRRADLTALFRHARHTLPAPVQVVGVSWLYNLDAYRRLFPQSYVATPRVIGHRFQSMTLWGQFLDRQGGLKESMTGPFLERLHQLENAEQLHECFPFQVLAVEAAVQDFYDFYGI